MNMPSPIPCPHCGASVHLPPYPQHAADCPAIARSPPVASDAGLLALPLSVVRVREMASQLESVFWSIPAENMAARHAVRVMADDLREANCTRSIAPTQEDDADVVAALTAVVREADQEFQRVGGSSRHWTRDCFLPLLNKAGFVIARALGRPREDPPHE